MTQKSFITENNSLACYQQAEKIIQGVMSQKLVLNDAVFSHWIKDSDCFWYKRQTQEGHEYRLVDASIASNQPAFNHQALSNALAKVSGEFIDPKNLPITVLELQPSLARVRFTAFEQHWEFNPDKMTCELVKTIHAEGLISPDGKKAAFVRDYNLWVQDIDNGIEHALTQDGTVDNHYASDCMGTAAVQAAWSPDSLYLLTHQLDIRQVNTTYFVQHVPQDNSVRPKLTEQKIAYPSDAQVATYRIVAIEVSSSQVQTANYKQLPQCRLGAGFFAPEKFGWWSQDSQRAFFVDVERGAQTVRIIEFDTQTGNTRLLFEETSPTFVKLSHGILERPVFSPLPDSDELIWFSERSGWAHLYLYDLNTGKLKHPITEGEWLVRDILHVDTKRRELLMQTAARDTTINSYYRDICRVNIDSGEMLPLALGNDDHVVFSPNDIPIQTRSAVGIDSADVNGVSPSGNYLVTTRSRVDKAPVSLLIDREGREVLTLETADTSGLPADWQWPEPIELKAADGETSIFGVIYRPPGFSPNKPYPVLDFSCAHPGYSYVPHGSFTNNSFSACYLEGAAYAALGFVVVAIEGRGTPYRHKAFQDESYGNMISANAFKDRIAGLHQLAKQYSYMDLDRVGIVGCDGITGPVYGLLEHPDFYKVGVVVALEDPRFGLASMVELFEGLFNTKNNINYAEDQAASLRGKLLLIHGMMDTFTPPMATFRLIEALRLANKDFDLLLLPSDGHHISSYMLRRTWDYLIRHLQAIEPPKAFKLMTTWDLL